MSTILTKPIIWSGFTKEFSKNNGDDWTLPEKQDIITKDVIFTRQNSRGIFNIAQETQYDYGTWLAPKGTKWAFAGLNGCITEGFSAANYNLIGLGNFATWRDSCDADPPTMVNVPGVVWIVNAGIFIDIMFTTWGVDGGDMTYVRGVMDNEDSTSGAKAVNYSSLSGQSLYGPGFFGNYSK